MSRHLLLLVLYYFCLLFVIPIKGHLLGAVKRETEDYYIVFLSSQSVNMAASTHIGILSALKGSQLQIELNIYDESHRSELDAKESHVYSYTRSFNAFAAKLSESEARELSGMDGVQSVILNQYRKLHTTRSWDFIGLPQKATRELKHESDIIIGVMDTGITPQSESFNDDGFGPPPAKWKGSCHHFANFSGCNNKLIGAKYFKLDGNPDPNDILSPVDTDGHGTHTSSTAAGSQVHNAELYGLAKGTARGAVPSARVAMYKVCWASSGCSDMDLLAGFDAAIHDGVDIISISIGGLTGPYTSDTISIGSFHAMNKGILTVVSAGNDGPSLGSVVNHAPWLFTVAASGIDRGFQSKVVLGNGKTVRGIGINGFDDPKQKHYPLITGEDVAINSRSQEIAGFCLENTLDPSKVKGKVVQCKLGTWGSDSVIKGLGGVGTIIESDVFLDTAQIFMAPATMVNSTVGETISKYIHSTRSPSAVIYKSEQVKVSAPFIATFSSRGPNPGTKHILKPDIAAPGVDILASYSPLHTLTGLKGDTQYSKFTIMSGTSMACPHVAGTAAYVKSFHPNWSPAAIKSAIMTSARPMRRDQDADELAYGVGQLNPRRAVSPGLIYDMDSMSYVQFLCHEGYNGSSMASLIGSKSKQIDCASLLPPLVSSQDAINYPTMQLTLKNNNNEGEGEGITTGVFRRSVTNVGHHKSTYNAIIKAPKGVNITVEPITLSFLQVSQTRSFKVTVSAKLNTKTAVVSGSLIWRSCSNVVRSPIVILNPQY